MTFSLPYELRLSFRFMTSKKSRGVSLNTLISVGGCTIGVAALISTLAVMTGFKEDLRDKILGTHSHIVITSVLQEEVNDAPALIEKAKKIPHVLAATPFVIKQVLLSSESGVSGIILRGIDPATEPTVTDIQRNIVEGKLEYLTHPPPISHENGANDQEEKSFPGIIIGRELAHRLGLVLGSSVHIISPVGKEIDRKGMMGSGGFTPKIREFHVVGIFDTGMYEYDATLAYVSIDAAQAFFNLSHAVTGIEVKVDNIEMAGEIADQMNVQIGFPYEAKDWLRLNRNLFSALQMEKMVMFIILVLIILVASFNIVSTLSMTVIEKSGEIAILKAMGATRRSVMQIFMLEGVLISGTGVAIGVPLGLAILSLLQRFYRLPGDVYYFTYLPMKMQPLDVFAVSCTAILIGFAATLYPAWHAAKLDPAEALRYR